MAEKRVSVRLAAVGGRPLIAYMAAAARTSRHLDEVVCSTDHAGIAEAAAGLGMRVDPRAPALARDDPPIAAVLVVEAVLKSHAEQAWVEVGAAEGVSP